MLFCTTVRAVVAKCRPLPVLGMASIVLGAAACNDPTSAQGLKFEVEGTVWSSDGRPIPEAHVWVSSPVRDNPEAWTDDEGYYLLRFQAECNLGVRLTASAGSHETVEKTVACKSGRQVYNFALPSI